MKTNKELTLGKNSMKSLAISLRNITAATCFSSTSPAWFCTALNKYDTFDSKGND